jgi:hypothetical protein
MNYNKICHINIGGSETKLQMHRYIMTYHMISHFNINNLLSRRGVLKVKMTQISELFLDLPIFIVNVKYI